MTYNDGNWTDEKPDVGKRYWYVSHPIDGVYDESNAFEAVFSDGLFTAPWSVLAAEDGYLRSVHPIPDPTPPPLPSKEPR